MMSLPLMGVPKLLERYINWLLLVLSDFLLLPAVAACHSVAPFDDLGTGFHDLLA